MLLTKRMQLKHQWQQIYGDIVIVAGSRSFNNYTLFESVMDYWMQDQGHDLVQPWAFLSGCARKGADSMIIRYAKERDHVCLELEALWNIFGKRRAGYIRNHEMGDIATRLVAFWDNRSNGTRDMINYARRMKLQVQPVLVDPDE